MKIYLAARYSHRDQLKELAAELTRMGHTITSSWLTTDRMVSDAGSPTESPEYRAKHAVIDAQDVLAADCVVSFTEDPDGGGRSGRGGRHVEFGLAVAWQKRIIVIGWRENVFHHLPVVEFFPSQWDMLRAIGSA